MLAIRRSRRRYGTTAVATTPTAATALTASEWGLLIVIHNSWRFLILMSVAFFKLQELLPCCFQLCQEVVAIYSGS